MTQLSLQSGYVAIGVAGVACLFVIAMSLLFIALRISSILSLQPKATRHRADLYAPEEREADLTASQVLPVSSGAFQAAVDAEIKKRQREAMARAREARGKK